METKKPATVAEAVATQNQQFVQLPKEQLDVLLGVAKQTSLMSDAVNQLHARLQAIEGSQAAAQQAVLAVATPAPTPAPAPVMVSLTKEDLQTLLTTTANQTAEKVYSSLGERLQAIESSQKTAQVDVAAATAQAVQQVPVVAPTPTPAPTPAPTPVQSAPDLTLSQCISRLSNDKFIDLCVEQHTMPRSNWDFCPGIDILRQGKYGHWQGAIANGVKTALLLGVAVGTGVGYVKFGQ